MLELLDEDWIEYNNLKLHNHCYTLVGDDGFEFIQADAFNLMMQGESLWENQIL